MQIEKFNKISYEIYDDSELSQEMTTALERVKSINVMISW